MASLKSDLVNHIDAMKQEQIKFFDNKESTIEEFIRVIVILFFIVKYEILDIRNESIKLVKSPPS